MFASVYLVQEYRYGHLCEPLPNLASITSGRLWSSLAPAVMVLSAIGRHCRRLADDPVNPYAALAHTYRLQCPMVVRRQLAKQLLQPVWDMS